MTSASAHGFFATSAEVAGALIGLLFVAISVSPERVLGPDASEIHSMRAAATLTAFTNALAVGLFGLVPGFGVGVTAIVVGILGIVFVVGAFIRLRPAFRAGRIHAGDYRFLLGLLVVFVIQVLAGLGLDRHEQDKGDLQTVCVLVIVCFLLGIARAWELVGGQRAGLTRFLVDRLRSQEPPPDAGGAEEE
jgi:hypothetical protein